MSRTRRTPVVVKIGGSAVDLLPSAWWDDLAERSLDAPVVCVHGWSRQLAAYQRASGRTPEFLQDQHGHRSRLTTPEVLADIRTVAGSLRAEIAQRLAKRHLSVRACSGEDGVLTAESRSQLWWRDERLERVTNLVGPVRAVSVEQLQDRLGDADALVLTPLASERRHGVINTDGDRAAASVAVALGAQHLLLVTDVAGVVSRGRSLHGLKRSEIEGVAREASGGMRKKLRAAAQALDGGVDFVHIGAASPTAMLAGDGTTVAS